MLLGLAADRQLLFVTGKGGVGKTSVASGLALARARRGARVLVVSTDPAHNLGHVWERPVGDRPTPLASSGVRGTGSVDGLEVDATLTVEQHLASVRETMRHLLPDRLHAQADRHLALAAQAPGMHESAVLERVAQVVEDAASYDLVVFDTAPSGHTVRLMALPEQLTAWTETLLANRDRSERFGAALRGLGGTAREESDAELRRVLLRRRRRFASLRDAVADPDRTSFVLVLTAERLPVVETLSLHGQLVGLGVHVGAVVVNRRSPGDAGALLAGRRAQEEGHVAVVRRELPDLPVVEVPLLSGDLVGEAALSELAEALLHPAVSPRPGDAW